MHLNVEFSYILFMDETEALGVSLKLVVRFEKWDLKTNKLLWFDYIPDGLELIKTRLKSYPYTLWLSVKGWIRPAPNPR